MKIMLDPGHGGGRAHNRGFINIQGFNYCNEGDCNFYYATQFLKPALEKAGIEVGITRKEGDPTDVPLATRGRMAKGYDLLISLHSNACGGNATGVEIWDSTNPKESIKPLCDKLCVAISQAIGTNNRGTKYRKTANGSNYYGILRNGLAKHNMIIEHAFHDNYQDCLKYVNNLDKIAKATVDTIVAYFNVGKGNNITEGIKPNTEPSVALGEGNFIEVVANELKGVKGILLNSVALAQAILESNWGKSGLAQKGKNLFGIKASHGWSGDKIQMLTTEEAKDGTKYKVMADFRKYDTYRDSILDHDNFFISTEWRRKNYERVIQAKDYKTQCEALELCGYATDSQYAEKLINLIERYDLKIFDEKQKDAEVIYRNMTICGKDVKAVAVENGVSYLWLADAKVKVPIREFFETLGMKVDWKDERIIVD